MKYISCKIQQQKGISLVIVIALIAVISAVVLPMARTTILEEKISKSHDWLNLSYTQARGELFKQSSKDALDTSQFQNIIYDILRVGKGPGQTTADHKTIIKFRDTNGTVYGYSIDRFTGMRFDVTTEGTKKAAGSYNKQLMGITYVAQTN